MLAKILTGGFVLIMVGAVIAGAIAVLGPLEEHVSAQAGEGSRFNPGEHAGIAAESQGRGQAGQAPGYGQEQGQEQGQGLGRGQGQGQGQGRGQAEGLEPHAAPESETIEGVVVATDELVIETASGKTVQVGLGPIAYREALGFVLDTKQNVRISGYWEDGEFKATQLENLTTNQSIVLRDSSGRPMWAGQGRGKNRSS
jgi:hypothetical protein